ncbi:MAG TPA: GAF domain-containing sensor histidine kinase, partial [Chitinophagaceae bacterium]
MQELTMLSPVSPLKTSFLEGGGELGELIRSYDWQKTPLGSPETWPQSLKTCVRIMLTSRQPIWIGWGKELIKLYNDPYKAIVGGKHPWALGQPASAVWKEIWHHIEPMLKTVMEKDEGTYVESQLLIMERNGYPEETYYTFSYTPIPGDKGGTAGMICANTDDTERIIGERQLRTLKDLGKTLAKMQTVTEVYQNALKVLENNLKDFPFAILYKIDNEERYASPIAYAGIDKGQTVFPSRIDLLNPVDGTFNFCSAFNKIEIVVSENKGRRKNLPKGAWEIEPSHFIHIPITTFRGNRPNAILSAALNPYRIYNDLYKQFTSLVADQISMEVNNVMIYEEERKRAEALTEIDKAKTVFFSNISHEFRTPLTLMLGPLEELLNDTKHQLNADEKNKIETTHRNAIRLLRLVNNLLDFSRIEAGRSKAQFQLTDIAEYTKQLAGNFRSAIENANLKFNVVCDPVSEPTYVDKSMWEKIVFNLLSNAFKYTLKGSVTVSVSSKGNNIELTVADTGVGIPEKELPKVFQRFHRIENVAGRSFEGSGIGLSLVSELVKIHNGSITVNSKPGEGSQFT